MSNELSSDLVGKIGAIVKGANFTSGRNTSGKDSSCLTVLMSDPAAASRLLALLLECIE